MIKRGVLLSAIMVLAIPAFAQIQFPVVDTFPSGGSDVAWEDYQGAYDNIEAFSPSAPGGDGYVMNVNDGSGWQKIHPVADDGSLGNYKITAYIYVPSSDGTDWGRVGIFGRADTENYDSGHYFLFADTDGDDYLRCGNYGPLHNGWTNYIDPPGTITRDAWHKFELSLDGTEIIAEIDDTVVHSGNEATDYATGYVGILTRQATTNAPVTLCDRVTIESLDELTATPTIPDTPTPSSGVDRWELFE